MSRLPRVVVALGTVSLLTDVASEMVYPLLPTLLAGLGAGAISLGAVEGVGDATAAVVKLFSGKLADRVERRKPLVFVGYGLSASIRALLALAFAPWQVVMVRFVDRIGKGIRSSPRDALLAASVVREQAAAAFGFHRGMDNLGATLGPLLVVLGLALTHGNVRQVIWASVIPGLLALVVIVLFVRDQSVPSSRSPGLAGSDTPEDAHPPSALRNYLVILGFFSIVNTSDLFLLRRLAELGATPSSTALSWAMLNGTRAISGYPGGLLADRIGRSRSMVLGWGVFAAAYAAMAASPSRAAFLASMVAYGLFSGLTEGAERAMVASLVPRKVLGSAFGRFHLVTGVAMLPSNLLFGWAWDRYGGPRCLATSAAGAVVALVALSLWTRRYVPIGP
jgi:MFS family permease